MGLIEDFTIGMIYVVVIGVVLFALVYASNQYLNILVKNNLTTTNSLAYKDAVAVQSNFYAFNEFVPLLFFGLNILALFLAAYLRPSPMNIAIGIMLLIFLPVISAILSNATRMVFLQPLLLPTAQQFPAILDIAAQFPIYTIAFGIMYLIIVAMRSKYYVQGQEGGPTQQVGSGAY